MNLQRHIGHIRIHMADDHAIPGTKMTPSIVDPMLRSPLPGQAPRVTMAIIRSLRFLLAEPSSYFSYNQLCRRPAVAAYPPMLCLYIVIATVNITALLNHPPVSIGGLQRAQRRAFAPPDRQRVIKELTITHPASPPRASYSTTEINGRNSAPPHASENGKCPAKPVRPRLG